MRIFFDQGTPVPLRHAFANEYVATAYEMKWHTLTNGDLLRSVEKQFDLLVTTDQNLRYQQNLDGRTLAVLVLPTTSWPRIRENADAIVAAARTMKPGEFRQLTFSESV